MLDSSMLRAYQGGKRNSWEMERRWRFLWFIWSKGHFFKPQKKNQWAPINLKSFLWIKSSFINPAVLMLQTDRQESVTWMFQPALGNDTVILGGIREVDSSSYTKIKSWGEEVTGQTPPISCRGSHDISDTHVLEYQIKIRNLNKPPTQRMLNYEGDKNWLIWGI